MTHKWTRKNKIHKNKTRSKRVNMNINMVYEKNAFTNDVFNKIVSMCDTISDKKMKIDPKASGRLMYTFYKNDPIYKLLYNKNFIKKVRSITGNKKLTPCIEIPIEYRKYSKGSYMDWHRDTQMLPDQLQYECVIKITNTSDSKTLFEKKNRIDEISSEPNSVILVRAQGIPHKVTKTNKGERTILKIVFKEKKC
jgi:hypothetical protein